MKYNGFYFGIFQSPMKKVIEEKYCREYADEIMKKSRMVYRDLVGGADDIGDDNPMAYNELFALAFRWRLSRRTSRAIRRFRRRRCRR